MTKFPLYYAVFPEISVSLTHPQHIFSFLWDKMMLLFFSQILIFIIIFLISRFLISIIFSKVFIKKLNQNEIKKIYTKNV